MLSSSFRPIMQDILTLQGFSISRRDMLKNTALAVGCFPILRQAKADDGFRTIEARRGSLRLVAEPQPETVSWRFDGTVPGPILRFKKGDELKIRLSNKLDQPLTLHWHGMRCPNAMSGIGGLTQPSVSPGETFDYQFTPQDSGLFWYHSHVLPLTGEQLGHGLYGIIVVDEEEPPHSDYDILIVLSDWLLTPTGEIENNFTDRQTAMGIGRIGSLITVNGKPVPLEQSLTPHSRVRLRIVSAMDSRVMFLGFDAFHPRVIAVDGMPCDQSFEPLRQTIPAGPGACFDLLFDAPETEDTEARLLLRGDKGPDVPLVQFKTTKEPARPQLPPIPSLPSNPLLPTAIPLQAAFRFNLVIEGGDSPEVKTVSEKSGSSEPKPEDAKGQPVAPKADETHTPSQHPDTEAISKNAARKADAGTKDALLFWQLNGKSQPGFAATPLFSVKRGTAVTLALINKTAFVQQMRVHGHCFRLLHDLDDGWEPYWRNAVLVPPGRTKRLAFIADNPGKWPIESLMAARQSTGLAGWFEVI